VVEVSSVVERAFEPTPKQRELYQVPFTVKEVLYGGSAGSGKTEGLVWMPLIYQFHEHPYYKGITLRRNLKHLEKEIIARAHEIYPHTGAIYNESKKFWKWPSGAKHWYGHCEHEKNIRDYDSDQYNLIQFDESTHFTEFMYLYMFATRLRSRSADLPAIMRSGSNPGNVGHSFFKKRFVAPDKFGGKIIQDGKDGLRRIFIPARITDNPELLKANPEYIKQLESLPEAEKRAKLLGDWDTYEGQVFMEWRIDPLPDEPENAKHVVNPFLIPDWWPRIIGIDWGFAAYTCIYWAAIAPNGRIYIYREYAKKEQKPSSWIADLINITGPERQVVEKIIICHSAAQHQGEETLISQLNKELRKANFPRMAELGRKDRIGGKLAIHEFLKWERPDIKKYYDGEFSKETADQIFRMYGQEAYEKYTRIWIEDIDPTPLPKLQVFANCELLIETIPYCIYEAKGEDGKAPEDVREFDGDDPYDTLRNLLLGIKEHLVRRAKDYEIVKERQLAIEAMATGDQTSFYRRMEHIERKQSKSVSVRRARFGRRMSSM
jgi:hypothetical protein